MSGIAGIIHFDGRPVEPGQVEAMTAAMHYRGPDGIHHWRKGNVALGQCMLRTTPESLEETQPLTNEDESLVLVMDGRVDNWEELRRELLGKGAILRTRADAELVLRAYEVWGRACLPHIEGDFALVIWDARRREAFCARDRVGNKPFNYHWNGHALVFASDLHALLKLPWITEVLNEGMLAEYLANEWYSLDETLWQGVLRLVPAHSFLACASGLQLHRYWAPDLAATLPCRTDEAYIEHYRAQFTDVVRRMSRSHQPLACEVSGGLDSSAIFAVAEILRQHRQLLAPGVDGYTLDFRGVPDADEVEYALAVGAHLERSIHEVAPAHPPLTWFREYAGVFREFPGYPNGSMSLSIADAARARGSRVLLSGLGGDEWLGGCRLYYAEALAGWRGRELRDIFKIDSQAFGVRSTLWSVFRLGLVPLLPRAVRRTGRRVLAAFGRGSDRGKAFPWLFPGQQELMRSRRQLQEEKASFPVCRLGQSRQLQHLYDPYITLAREMNERQAAYAGLELRQPFWDHRLVQSAFATPEYFRLRGGENKWLHRQAMGRLLPERILRRNSKAEFSVTIAQYWTDLSQVMIDDILPRRGSWVLPEHMHAWLRQGEKQRSFDWSAEVRWIPWTIFGVDLVERGNSSQRPESSVGDK